MKLITIDPGRNTGVAIFENERLSLIHLFDIRLEKLEPLNFYFFNVPPDKVVIEIPQVYSPRLWKGDPNDLISVAIVAGFFAHMLCKFGSIQFVRPHDWKGNRPKDVDHALTMSRLTAEEKNVLTKEKIPKSKLHNIIDAVGIGLWKLGRR